MNNLHNNNTKLVIEGKEDGEGGLGGEGFNMDRAYITDFGKAPITHTPVGTVKVEVEEKTTIGQKIIILDLKSDNHSNFISLKTPDQIFRPVGIKFNPNGTYMYIISVINYSVIKIASNEALLPVSTQ